MNLLELQPTDLDSLYDILDVDESGTLDFHEFTEELVHLRSSDHRHAIGMLRSGVRGIRMILESLVRGKLDKITDTLGLHGAMLEAIDKKIALHSWPSCQHGDLHPSLSQQQPTQAMLLQDNGPPPSNLGENSTAQGVPAAQVSAQNIDKLRLASELCCASDRIDAVMLELDSLSSLQKSTMKVVDAQFSIARISADLGASLADLPTDSLVDGTSGTKDGQGKAHIMLTDLNNTFTQQLAATVEMQQLTKQSSFRIGSHSGSLRRVASTLRHCAYILGHGQTFPRPVKTWI